jgi:DNA mismatch repair protein MutS2
MPEGIPSTRAAILAPGARVTVGALGLEGTVQSVSGGHVEVDVRGKRMRARVGEITVISGPPPASRPAPVRVHVDLAPREGMLSELQVIGCAVEEAVDRVSKFLDGAMLSDLREVRIVHGFGTGQLRKGIHAFLKRHPLVLSYGAAPDMQGGGGATVVTLKD